MIWLRWISWRISQAALWFETEISFPVLGPPRPVHADVALERHQLCPVPHASIRTPSSPLFLETFRGESVRRRRHSTSPTRALMSNLRRKASRFAPIADAGQEAALRVEPTRLYGKVAQGVISGPIRFDSAQPIGHIRSADQCLRLEIVPRSPVIRKVRCDSIPISRVEEVEVVLDSCPDDKLVEL